jgi:hypothetical protein
VVRHEAMRKHEREAQERPPGRQNNTNTATQPQISFPANGLDFPARSLCVSPSRIRYSVAESAPARAALCISVLPSFPTLLSLSVINISGVISLHFSLKYSQDSPLSRSSASNIPWAMLSCFSMWETNSDSMFRPGLCAPTVPSRARCRARRNQNGALSRAV